MKKYNWKFNKDKSECWCALQEIGNEGEDIIGGPTHLRIIINKRKNLNLTDTASFCLQYGFTPDLEEIGFSIFSDWDSIKKEAERCFNNVLDAIS